jgi:hypothetical protein
MEPFGTALFCDDIRFESLGKLTLVGTYGYEMVLFGAFPATLPKLGIHCSVRFHKSQSVSGVKIMIYFPGDAEDSPTNVQDLPIQLNAERFPNPEPPEYPDPSNYYGFNHPMLFSPVIIKQPGYIRVRAVEGTSRIKIGLLRIREASSEEIAQVSANTSS